MKHTLIAILFVVAASVSFAAEARRWIPKLPPQKPINLCVPLTPFCPR